MRTFFAFALLAVVTGCGNASEDRAAPPGCADGAVAPDTGASREDSGNTDAATAPAPEALSWVVEFPTAPKLEEIPALTFRGAAGLAPVVSEIGAGDAVSLTRSTTPFDGFGGETKDATALAAWWEKILSHTPCDTCDPTREWIAAGLMREAIVTAKTADGEWLARWTLVDAWPAEVLAGKRADGGFEVASLRLAGAPSAFEMNPKNPWLGKQLTAASLTPTTLPEPSLSMGKAPSFAASILVRPISGVDDVVDGLSTFAKSVNPLYQGGGNSGDNPLFEPKSRAVIQPNLEVRDGDVVLLRAVGLKQEIEIIEYKNGDDSVARKRPGKTKFKNLTLSRGEVTDARLLTWYNELLVGANTRKSISVIAYGRDKSELTRFTAVNAVPAPTVLAPTRVVVRGWDAPKSNPRATREGHMVESITFVVERFERAK